MTHETKAGIAISASFICLVGYVVAKKSWEPPVPVASANVGSDGKSLIAPDPTPPVNPGASENVIPTLKSPPAANGELLLTGGRDDNPAGKSSSPRDDKDPFAQTPLISPTPSPNLPLVTGDTKPAVPPDTKLAETSPLKPQDGDTASAEAMRKAREELNKKTATGTIENVADAQSKQNQPAVNIPSLNPEPPKQASDNTPRPSDVNPFAIKQPTAPAPIETPAGAGSLAPKQDTPALAGATGVDSGAKVVIPQGSQPDNPAGAGGLQPLGMSPAGAPTATTGPGTANGSSRADAAIGTERPLAPLGTAAGGSGQSAIGQTASGTNGADFPGSAQNSAPGQPPYDPMSRPVIGLTPAATAPPMQAALPLKKARALVDSFDAKIYICRQGDTFASISMAQYGSDKYGQALFQYNLDDPGAGSALQPGMTTLQANQRILIPVNAYTLQGKYAALIVDRPGAMTPVQTTPIQTVSGATASSNPIATAASVTGERSYRVHTAGEMFLTIARNTLGNEDRWPEIYRLNPRFDPKDALPGGSILRMPGDARIAPADVP